MIDAVSALVRGTRMVYTPGLRRFVFVPLAINLVLYSITLWVLFNQFGGWIDYWMLKVPAWLDWLSWLIWPLLVVSLLLVVFFTFSLVTNLIAAPFYGILAEKVEHRLDGTLIDDDRGLVKIGVDSLGREMAKLGYFIPRMIALFIIGFIPGLNLLSPLLWGLFSAWSMSIQYLDYPMDNHQVSFGDMKQRLKARWWPSLTFGAAVFVMTLVPLANLLFIPGAVAGAVLMWQSHYRQLPAPRR
ncbi:sulfate transporter CysZ [Cobetia sp. LC6]|uniref:sulfate transporter CysZ n=1 Tax=Cobetia sp. LC6 TaxID=3050947 RepID=UPI0025552B54|nr:sulfate transporter CysZ [Cobetia sp. LC6]MDL2190962.1 sulfate transporter CysZ [Cobetia sp. LC6]